MRNARAVRRRVLLLAALAVVGVAIHLWFALGGDGLNSDAALVILMARHFAHGDLALYFWQQNWMLNIEPLLLSPLAMAGLATPLTAGLVAIALTAALAFLSVRLAQRLGGSAWMALLVWAVPPAVVVHHHVTLYGARLAATLIVLAAFVWTLLARSQREWLGIGALTGLAYFGDHLMIAWAAAVMFVAMRRHGLRAFAAGAVPLVLIDGIAAVMTPAYHLVGPNFPHDWLPNVWLLVGTVLPQLFGVLLGRAPTPEWQAVPTVIPHGTWWLLFAIPGVVVLALLFVALVRNRRAIFGDGGTDAGLAAQALAVLTVVQLGIFALVGGGGDTWSVRYLVPLWPAISIFAALAVARWRAELRPLAALAVLPALYTLGADHSWPRAEDAPQARAEAAAVHDAIAASGVHAVWAGYWDAYRMAVLTGELPRWVPYRTIDRRPDWLREARAAQPVGYLVRDGDAEILAALDAAEADGIPRLEQRALGRFQFVVMARSVPGLEFRSPPPSRFKQVLAAVSADALFFGALLLGALLPLLLRGVEVQSTAAEVPAAAD